MPARKRKVWPIHEAKAGFTSLVRAAEEDGPQQISRHGQAVAVVMSARDYMRLQERRMRGSLIDFLASAPPFEAPPRDRSDVTSDIDL
jgi:prevent-host-death family protein